MDEDNDEEYFRTLITQPPQSHYNQYEYDNTVPTTVLDRVFCDDDDVDASTESDIERSNAVDALRKRVIKRLIDVTSPSTIPKQNMFRKLARDQDDTRVIVEMAVEMEASVEDTTKMLMNNCS